MHPRNTYVHGPSEVVVAELNGESLDTSHPLCVYTPIAVPATTSDLHLWTQSLQNTKVIKNT